MPFDENDNNTLNSGLVGAIHQGAQKEAEAIGSPFAAGIFAEQADHFRKVEETQRRSKVAGIYTPAGALLPDPTLKAAERKKALLDTVDKYPLLGRVLTENPHLAGTFADEHVQLRLLEDTIGTSKSPRQRSDAELKYNLARANLDYRVASTVEDLVFQSPDKYLAAADIPAFTKRVSRERGIAATEEEVRRRITAMHAENRENRPLWQKGVDQVGKWYLRPIGGDAVPRLGAGIAGVAEMVSGVAGDVAGLVLPDSLNANRKLEGYSRSLAKRWAAHADESGISAGVKMGEYTATEAAVASGIASVWQSLATMPLGGLALKTGASTLQAAVAGVAPIAAITAGGEFTEAQNKGKDFYPSLAYGLGQGTIEGGTELLPGYKLFKDLKVGTSFFRTVATNIIAEAPSEQLATLGQDLLRDTMLHPEKTFSDYLDERADAAYSTLVATFVSAGLQSAVMHRVAGDALAAESLAAAGAQADHDKMKELLRVAAQLDAVNNAPESFSQLVQQVAEGSGQPANVYIPAQVLQQTLAQMSAEEAESVTAKMPSAGEQFANATAPDSLVQIPLGEFTTAFAQAEQDALLREVKFDPDRLSLAESETFAQEQLTKLTSEAQGVLADKPAAREQWEKEKNSIVQDLVGQMSTVARDPSSINRAQAQLTAEFISVAAKRTKSTPAAVWKKYRQTITGGTGPTPSQELVDQASDEFTSWFGKSGVVSAEGAPLVVYHGTRPGNPMISRFELPHREDGVYFTPDPSYAEGFTINPFDPQDGNGAIYPSYISLQNPHIVEAAYGSAEWDNFVDRGLNREELIAQGFDGAILKDAATGQIDQVMAFFPEQIRSVYATPTARGAEANEVTAIPEGSGGFHHNLLAQTIRAATTPNEAPLAGAPAGVRPISEVRELAAKYVAFAGIQEHAQTTYVKVNPHNAKIVADLYENAEVVPGDPLVKAAYEALKVETLAQYQAIKQLGWTFEMIPEGTDPYPGGPTEAIADMRKGHLWVYPTTSGFGQEGQAPSYLEELTDEYIGDHQLMYNDVFRIVHDVFGHGKEGNGFGPIGEENAWQSHVRMYSPLAARAMTVETRGQNSWMNYGPHGEHNRTNQRESIFAVQKMILLPEWVSSVDPRAAEPLLPVATLDSFKPGAVADILAQGNWAVFTAANPNAKTLSKKENAKRNANLVKDLEEIGATFVEVNGNYFGTKESSFLVTNISAENARALGAKYEQESILTRKGFEYTDGRVVPATGVTEFTTPPADNYSIVPSTGAMFAVELDWDVKRVDTSVAYTPSVDALPTPLRDAFLSDEIAYNLNAPHRKALRDVLNIAKVETAPAGGVSVSFRSEATDAEVQRAAEVIQVITGARGVLSLETAAGLSEKALGEIESARRNLTDEILAFKVKDVAEGRWSRKYSVDSGASNARRVFADGPAAEGANPSGASIIGKHFSNHARKTIDGRFYGTGFGGAERSRVLHADDTRLRSRVYMYVDEGAGVQPESGVGAIPHIVRMDNLYDLAADPLKLRVGQSSTDLESDILDAGYDGIYIRNAFPSMRQGAAVLLGNAAHSVRTYATEEEAGGVSFNQENPIWKSALGETVLAGPAVQPGKQWLSWLKSQQQKGAFRAVELEASGLADWLALQERRVERSELAAFLMDTNFKIVDYSFGAEVGQGQQWTPEAEERAQAALKSWSEERERELQDAEDAASESFSHWYEYAHPVEDEEGWWVEDEYGHRYSDGPFATEDEAQELVYALSEDDENNAVSQAREEAEDSLNATEDYSEAEERIREEIAEEFGLAAERDPKFARWTLPGPQEEGEYVELLLRDANAENLWKGLAVAQEQERTARRDWAKAEIAVEKDGDTPENTARVNEAKARVEATTKATKVLGGRTSFPGDGTHFGVDYTLAHTRMTVRADSAGVRTLVIEELQSDSAQKLRARFEDGSGVPGMFRTENWTQLLIKRAIRYAADNGISQVAWTTGKQQSDRYRLTNHIDEITVERQYDGLYNLEFFKGGQRVPVTGSWGMTAAAVKEMLGQSLGEKTIQLADENPDSKNLVSGSALEIGGEGMKQFYDKIVPQNVRAVLKKMGGGDFKAVEVPNTEDVTFVTETRSIHTTAGHGFFISYIDRGAWGDSHKVVTSSYETQGEASAALAKALQLTFANGHASGPARITALYDGVMTTPPDDVRDLALPHVLHGVVLSEETLAAAKLGMPFLQLGEEPRGTFNPTTLNVALLEKANLSTYLHETGHYFLRIMELMAAEPDAPQELKDDFDILLKWAGVAGDTAEARATKWATLTVNQQREAHEKFAETFEQYLFTAQAPSQEMRSLFRQYRGWLGRVYGSIKQMLLTNRRAELTEEVRGVMDRMLATSEQIALSKEIVGVSAKFDTPEQARMTSEEWAAYQIELRSVEEDAIEQLDKRSLRDMQWLGNARSRAIKDLQREAKATRKKVQAEVEAKVRAQPVYQAIEFFRTGRLDEKKNLSNEQRKALESVDASHKLSLPAIKEMLGENNTLWSQLKGGRYGVVAAEGLHPEMIAPVFGYNSAYAMLNEIVNARPIAEVIADATDERMLLEYGDITDEREMARAADEALHNVARTRFVATELTALEKALGAKATLVKAVKAAASEAVGRTLLGALRPRQSAAQERKASRAAKAALKKGDIREAITQTRNELLHIETTREMYDAQKEVEKARVAFKRVFASDARLEKTRNMDLVNAARAILADYGLGPKVDSPDVYLEKLKQYDPDTYADVVSVMGARPAATQDVLKMSVDDFRALRDVVASLWHFSRESKRIEIRGRKVEIDAVGDELVGRLVELSGGELPAMPGTTGTVTDRTKWEMAFAGMRAALRRVESWADNLGTPFTKYIFEPVSAGVTAYRTARNEVISEYLALLKTIEKRLTFSPIEAPDLNFTFNGGKSELLHAILHTGNSSNKSKLLLGYRWGEQREDGSVDDTKWNKFIERMFNEGILDKADMDFVQAVWDLNEKHKASAQKAHKALYGVYFKEITADEVQTPVGTYRGGYVPAIAESLSSPDAAQKREQEDLTHAGNSFMFPTTGRGFTKSRVDGYTRPLALDLRMMAGHLDKVMRFTHLEPAIKQTGRLLVNKRISNGLNKYDQTAISNLLNPWLQRSARQTVTTRGKYEKVDAFFSGLRSRAGMQVMMLNVVNALQQITGIAMAAVKVPAPILLRSLVTYMRNPNAAAEQVRALSPWMIHRMDDKSFELQNHIREIMVNPNAYEKTKDFTSKNAYVLQQVMQNIVDVVVWRGAYDHAMAKGLEGDDAVRAADAAVRLTQGSFAAEDVSLYETGTPFVRLFTQFAGYFNMQANLLGTEVNKAVRDMGYKDATKRLGVIYFFGMMIPAVLAEAIAKGLPDDEDDEDGDGLLDEWLAFFFGSQFRTMTAMVPGVGHGVQALVNFTDDVRFNDRLNISPGLSMAETAVRASASVVSGDLFDEEVKKREVRDALMLIGLATGLPGGTVARPAGYAADMAAGKTTAETPVGVAKGLIVGRD